MWKNKWLKIKIGEKIKSGNYFRFQKFEASFNDWFKPATFRLERTNWIMPSGTLKQDLCILLVLCLFSLLKLSIKQNSSATIQHSSYGIRPLPNSSFVHFSYVQSVYHRLC